jgi:hypothetical protein
MHKRTVLVCGLAAILAGCGDSGSPQAGDPASAGAGASPAPAPVPTLASGAPRRADGMWALKNVGGGGTVIGTQQLCVDAGSEAKASLFDQIARNTNCSKYEIARAGGGWSFEFVCGASGMTSTSKGQVSGDFATSYKVEMTEGDGTMELSRTIEARRTGECPAGVSPGTLLNEQGAVVADITRD